MIGFVLAHEQFPVPRLVELGVAAEKADFDAVWTSDHFHPWQANQGHCGFAWVTLAALGQRMPRIPFGTGVTCPTFRYRPAIVAQGFATLGLLCPGRVFLGVGTGEALNEVPAGGGWGGYRERVARLEEAIAIIRQLWTGDTVTYHGTYYQVEKARLYDVPPEPIPIYVAAGGPKSTRMAGEHGDGLITDSQQAVRPEIRQAFAEGARAAGKDPSRMPILVEHWVVVGDEDEARRWTPLWQFSPRAWTHFVDDPDPEHIQREAQATIPLDEVYRRWPVSRDPAVHVEAIQRLLDNGVTHVFVHSPQGDQEMVIDFFSREVLPRLKRPRA